MQGQLHSYYMTEQKCTYHLSAIYERLFPSSGQIESNLLVHQDTLRQVKA